METIPSPQIENPLPVPQQGLRWGPIIRDIVIICGLTFIGGFIVGVIFRPFSSGREWVLIVSNMLLCTIGFVISGCLAVGNRWGHLAYVAFGVWLTNLINILLAGSLLAGFITWFASSFFIALTMVFGGAISYVFKKNTQPSN